MQLHLVLADVFVCVPPIATVAFSLLLSCFDPGPAIAIPRTDPWRKRSFTTADERHDRS